MDALWKDSYIWVNYCVYHFICLSFLCVRILKFYSLSKLHNAVLSVILPSISSSDLTHVITESLCPFTQALLVSHSLLYPVTSTLWWAQQKQSIFRLFGEFLIVSVEMMLFPTFCILGKSLRFFSFLLCTQFISRSHFSMELLPASVSSTLRIPSSDCLNWC